jgi:hypothetical protein
VGFCGIKIFRGGSLCPRASIAVQVATVPDIARPDTTLIASRICGIKMIFLLQPNLIPLGVVGGRLRAARALVLLFLGRLRGASGGRAVR